MTQNFDNVYQNLNGAQQSAVDNIEGPVMVIAGPGTGKTQILATRILNILQSTDVKPEEILCLTYTESGAHNMKQRLATFMGPDAYKVNIHTFHGLCNKIIKDFPDKFSFRELRLIDDIEKIDIINDLIRNLEKDSPIKSYADDPAPLRKQLGTVFSLMQEEGYTRHDFIQWTESLKPDDAFVAAFPDLVYTRKYLDFKPGDIKRSQYNELFQHWEKLIAASLEYEKYTAAKAKLGVFEFSDMIEWVATALEKDEDLLMACQEQFQYVLVDEYQDTSGLQNLILLKIISFWDENPNCFVVGDDDQSIYAFQGAKLSNMMAFADKYRQNINTIVLTSNYRSTKEVLESAERLIGYNQDRLVNKLEGLSKNLEAKGPFADLGIPVKCQSFKNRFHEAIWVCNDIQSRQSSGIDLRNMAVIYPKHKLADDLVSVLRSRSIPFVLAKEVDVLQEPIIKELLNWLKYLAEELDYPHKGEYLLYEMLHSPMYDLAPFEIAKLSSEIYNKGNRSNPVHWREYFSELATKPVQGNLFDAGSQTAVTHIWSQIETWLKEASMYNVPQMIEYIYSTGGFLGYALRDSDKNWTLEVLNTFLHYAVGRNEKSPFISMKQFLVETEVMMANGISLPLEKQIGSDEGIILTTAHRAKGLEFDYVYVLSADQESWEKDRSFGLPYKVSQLIKGKDIKRSNEQNEQENFEEKRRLFYVAITRAKQSLTVTWSHQKIDSRGTQLLPSQFVVEMTNGELAEENKLDSNDVAGISEKILAQTGTPKMSGFQENWVRKQLEGLKLSPTTLYTLFECGLKFYFQRLVRVPSAPNASAGYGSAMHNALANWVKQGNAIENGKWLDAAGLVGLFEREMYKVRSSFSEASYKNKLQQGRDILPEYHKARIDIFNTEKVVVTEQWYQSVVEGVEIGGYTDKLIFNGNNVVIVDYKSGNPTYAEKKFKAPTGKQLSEGKLPPQYWFQVGIYHLVIGNIKGKDWNPVMGLLDLLDKDANGDFLQLKMTYNSDDLDLLKHYIREGKKKLDNLDFMVGCNQCEWCEFAKQTGQVVWVPKSEDGE